MSAPLGHRTSAPASKAKTKDAATTATAIEDRHVQRPSRPKPDSPFAKLAALKAELEKNKKG